jgi:hypothetical protein
LLYILKYLMGKEIMTLSAFNITSFRELFCQLFF